MGILTLSGVKFCYASRAARYRPRRDSRRGRVLHHSQREVLRELNLDVPRGEVTAILGPNGAGKTTLLNICLGWLKPQAGTVSFESRPLGDYTRREVGRSMSLVPQSEHIPFEYSLLEYVLLGRAPYLASLESPGPDDVTLATEMIERVGMADRLNASVLATSAGEKQLIMLARSLTQEPGLFLLDEPSAHLDLRNKRRLIGLLHAEVERGATVLLTAHEPEFAAAVASNVVLMRAGRVMDAGPMDNVMTTKSLSATYDLPITVHRIDDRLAFHW